MPHATTGVGRQPIGKSPTLLRPQWGRGDRGTPTLTADGDRNAAQIPVLYRAFGGSEGGEGQQPRRATPILPQKAPLDETHSPAGSLAVAAIPPPTTGLP
jgi:hypothetical protein